MRKVIILFIMLIMVAFVFSENRHLCTPHQKTNPAISQKNEIYPGEMTVMFHENIKTVEISNLMDRYNCQIAYTSPYLGFHKVLIPASKTVEEMVSLFQKEEIVDFAEPNVKAHAFWTPNDEYYPYQWHFDTNHLDMAAAWDIEPGGIQDVLVAIIDSGIAFEDHTIPAHEQSEVTSNDGMYHQAPDLANTNFVSGYDFVHNDNHPNDQNGHGTHCAGTVAQSTNNNSGVAGMAFNSTLMPVQVLDYSGQGATQWIADGVAYAVQNGADILSMSLGGAPGDATGWEVVHVALQQAVNQNVVPIIAVGNHGVGTLSYPAAYEECIAVGATDYDNDLAPYSQYGPGIDIVAPGGNIGEDLNSDGYVDGVLQNTFADGMQEPPHNVCNFDYMFFQGTSMATPHVSGLAALLTAHGITGFQNIKNALYETATDIGNTGYDEVYGWGMINPAAALQWNGGGNETVLLEESFEAGTAEGWISLDNDYDGYGWTIYSEIENPGFDLAYDGDYGIGVQYNSNGNDDWLISPPITLDIGCNASLSFFARSHSADYLEDFNVKISTTNNDIVSFTNNLASIQNAPDTWQEYTYDISIYQGQTIYFAIQCVSVDDWYLFADYFKITQAAADADINVCSNKLQLDNYPNPFNPTTTIKFSLADASNVDLSIYNIKGQQIKTLTNKQYKAGNHTIQWHGTDSKNQQVASGVYFYRLSTDNMTEINKMLLLK